MASSKVSLIFCQNPFCKTFEKKPFANQRAYSNHINGSPGCFNFLVRQAHVAAGHGTSVPRRHHNVLSADGDVTWTSTIPPTILRRQMVNNNTSEACGLLNKNVAATTEREVLEMPQAVCFDDNAAEVEDNTSVHFDDHNDVVLSNTSISENDEAAPSFRSNFMYTTDQKWTVTLLKILDEANAPDYTFGQILEWSRNSYAEGYSYNPVGGLSRSKNVDALINSVHNGHQLLPFVQRVMVPHGAPSDVVCFDFAAQLLSILQNRSIMTAENLVIDINDPLKPFTSKDNVLGEALSGSVYRKAYDRLITDPSKQLFVPIIQWIDRTSVTGNDRFSLKPYMFTPAIFTEKFRRHIKAWGYHGFLPKRKSSSAQNQVLRQGDPIRNYHAELDGVLQSFRECGERLRGVFLPIGPKGCLRVDIVTCVLFVIQDMQEGDMLCGRFGVHTSGVQRHSRSCDVNYDGLDNCDVSCKYLKACDMDQISRMDPATRTQWSQHQVDNAFNGIEFADPVRGIFGATPVETMHAFRKGVIENVTFLVLDNVPPSKKAALDNLAIAFHKSHRQTHRKTFPSTDFSNGITNLTKISASERLGLVFLFVILFQYEEGWQIIQSCLDKRTKKKVPEVLQVFESLLCFDAWLNKSEYWSTSNPHHVAQEMAGAQASIRKFMEMCKSSIPIKKENAWKFPKFHELLHVVDDISRFGSPANFCAQRPESLLISAAKQPGRRAQKRTTGSAYELQAAQRLTYSFMIDTVHGRIWEKDLLVPDSKDEVDYESTITTGGNEICHSTGQATFGSVSRRRKQGEDLYQYEIIWNTRTHSDLMKLQPDLVKFVCDSFEGTEKVVFCTEYRRDVHTFRCHPCYQSDGPIYDWVVINFGNHGNFPCRLALVVVVDSPSDPDEKYQLVVQSTTEEIKEHESTLLREWKWSPQYIVVSANTVVAPCFVISISHDGSTVLETKPYEEWASKFT